MSEIKLGIPDNVESITHDDPSTKIWTPYISAAEKHDRNLARSWKGDMDAILIFAGLFSASVTAFIIESYKTLTPDTGEITISLLAQISQQLSTMTNTSMSTNAPPVAFTIEPFVPTTSSLVCNTLWFLSLGFSLVCALSATLVEQWVRNYLQATDNRPIPHERARINAYLYKGLEKFKMAALVETIPMLLHISLLLFFAGLIEFLRPINAAISGLMLAMLITCGALYTLATVIPIFSRNCPYQTPLSGVWWRVMRALRLLRRRDQAFGGTIPIKGSMAKAREADAIEISPERDQRDLDAMCWTLRTLREDTELESFVEVIPRVVSGFDYSAKLLLQKLVHYKDLSIKLSHRVPRLLITCAGGALDPLQSQKRATTCLAAIWSLNVLSMHTDSSESPDYLVSRANLRFDEHTLRDIRTTAVSVPAISGHAASAMTVIAQSLLDLYTERLWEIEQELAAFTQSGNVDSKKERQLTYLNKGNDLNTGATMKYLFKRIQRAIEVLDGHLCSGEDLTSPIPFVLMSTVYLSLRKLLSVTTSLSNINSLEVGRNTSRFLRDFQVSLNQARFSLTLQYVATILSGPTLPHEAFNTIRRIFLKINFDIGVSVEAQRRLVTHLDDALDPDLDGSTRIPQSIINIILGLTQAIADSTCALKAKTIIQRCMRSFPNAEEAQKAVSRLDSILPPPTPTLDLFSSHMYSDIRLDKSSRQPNPDPAVNTIISLPRRQHETA